VVHYPAVLAANAATLVIPPGTTNAYPLAPGVLATICPLSQNQTTPCRSDDPRQFGEQTATNKDLPNPYPLPTTLADVQVLLNGNPVPLQAVMPQQINFQVPMTVPRGDATLEVMRVSTGQTLGSFPVTIKPFLPGLFKADPPVHTTVVPDVCGGLNGICYQALANNQDGSLNSPTNPASRGTVISVFGTGQGVVDNAPADGDLTPDSQIPTPFKPQVALGGAFVTDVSFSGLAPGMVGVWRVDMKIPDTVAPGSQIVFLLTPDQQSTNTRGVLQFTVQVKQ
jgi:uncharacterized protein (TIGR03437 family)